MQLDEPHSDENHNTADIKADLRRELDKTDRLLQKMRTRLCNARATHAPCDAESLRAVLDDMVGLLQQQQRLYRQAVELAEPSPAHGRQEGGGAGEDASQVVQLPAAWVRGLERRLSTAIRRSVRRELLKAKPSLRKPRHVSSS